MKPAVSRGTVLERLRRVLFAPTRLLAVGALTLAFVNENAAFAQHYAMPNVDFTVNAGETLDLSQYVYVSSQNYDSVIKLNGGAIIFSRYGTATRYNSNTRALYQYNLRPTTTLTDEQQIAYAEFIKQRYGEVVKDENGVIVSSELETRVGNPIERYYERSGHILDLSGGGAITVLTTPNAFNLNDILVAPQEVMGALVKNGSGGLIFENHTLEFSRNEKGELSVVEAYGGKSTFHSTVDVEDGDFIVFGDSQFLGDVAVKGANSSFVLDQGTHAFDANFLCDGGTVGFGGHDGQNQKVVFNGDVEVGGGYFFSYGDVEYNGEIRVEGQSLAFFTSEYDGTHGRAKFSDDSKIIVDGAGVDKTCLAANANCLQVDLQIDNNGLVLICNADQKIDDEPFKNEYFVTYDEYQTPTILEWEAGRDNIEQALALDNVLNREITGNGRLLFSTLGEKFSDDADAANGYTVVLDAKNQAQEKYDEGLFDFSGKTTVGSAFLVVKGGSNYGSVTASSQFNVYGESYRLDSVSEKGARWEVQSCGMLGFYRGDETDPTKAPSISAGRVRFNNGLSNGENANVDLNNLITKGSRIWIDATYRDENGKIAQVDHKLGAINARELIFGSGTEIWYDGVSSVASNVKMTFELNAEAIGIGDNLPLLRATDEEISNLFSQALLIDASYKRNDPNSKSSAGTVTVTSRNLADYASDVGMSAEEIKYAQKLDEARLRTEADQAFNDALYNETDASKVTQTIHNLSLLGYDMLNAQGHFGNPTSAFFGGSSVSGEAKRGQEAESDWDDELKPKQKSVVEKKTNADIHQRTLWAAYTHTSVEGDDYTYGGIKTHGYQLRRHGVVGGVKRQIDATTSGGLFFGISTPEITSNKEFKGRLENGAAYGDFVSSMEMTDFQFAVHVEKVFADVWELAAYVGGGAQGMDWERKVNLTNGGLYGFDASGSGNTFTATLYLSNRLDVGDRLTLRPTVGVDSEHSWLYGFTENAIDGETGNGVAVDYYMNMFAQNYTYAKTYYNRNTARAGLSLACDAPSGYAGLNARAFYGVKLGGDDAPELSYRSNQYRFENMTSHEMGDSSLNVGGGGFMHLNRQKTLTATGDVNAIWYKNAQTFNVTGGVSYRF